MSETTTDEATGGHVISASLSTDSTTDWTSVREELQAHTVTWTDAAGLHVTSGGQLPEERPRYATHLWSWHDQTMTRLRLTETTIYRAVLSLGERPDEQRGTLVRVRCEPGLEIWEQQGATATLKLAPDTDETTIPGTEAEAFTVISTSEAGLAFIRCPGLPDLRNS